MKCIHSTTTKCNDVEVLVERSAVFGDLSDRSVQDMGAQTVHIPWLEGCHCQDAKWTMIYHPADYRSESRTAGMKNGDVNSSFMMAEGRITVARTAESTRDTAARREDNQFRSTKIQITWDHALAPVLLVQRAAAQCTCCARLLTLRLHGSCGSSHCLPERSRFHNAALKTGRLCSFKRLRQSGRSADKRKKE